MTLRLTKRSTSLVGAGLAAALLLAGCGSSDETETATPETGPVAPAASGAAAASDAGLNYKGTLREPASTPRPAAKGKKIAILSAGQASISSSVPVGSAEEAAKAIGWQTAIYDVQLNPANAPALVRQAIAAGVDGIILQAVDCPGVKGPLQEAKAKGIKVIGIYSFDCNDPVFGGTDAPLFTDRINFGDGVTNYGAFTEKYGADQAKAVIAATGGKAKVVFFNSPTVTVLKYTGKGFLDELKKCTGCSVVAEIEFAGSELGPNLQQKATTALLQHPEANAVKSPYTSATLLGFAPAVVQSGRAQKLYVMGGEGFAPELDLLRAGQGVNAVNIAPSDWNGWASVDTMNSLFTGAPIVDSGLGWQLVDKGHNLPKSGPFVPPVKFKDIYKKAWGV
ncbi:MAG: LigA protein [Frankiales bacterium]|nr:LigA protein [Frankiales bacterium]